MWYVCFCDTRKVLRLVEELAKKGDRVECPEMLIRRRIPRSSRYHVIRRPLIPGIFFCEEGSWPLGGGFLAGVDLAKINRMFYAGSPARIQEKELSRLRAAVKSGLADRNIYFRPGTPVLVAGGAFVGMRGEVIQTRRSRVRVSIEGLGAIVEIEAFLLLENER